MKNKKTTFITIAIVVVAAVAVILTFKPFLQKTKTASKGMDSKPVNTDMTDMREENARDFGKQDAIGLYKDKFFKDMPASEFPDNAAFEEIDNRMTNDIHGRSINVKVCYIVPEGFVSEKSGEYEIGGYVLNVDSWSTPSVTGLYVIINDSEIYTIDEAFYSRKYSIDMQDLYTKLPQRYRDLEYISLTSSQNKELEQIAGRLVAQNLEAFREIFVLDTLPADVPNGTWSTEDENSIFSVKSDKYKTMSDLENFVRNTYIKRTADKLLYGTLDRGPIYVEKDGKLCIDFMKVGGMGYNTDWENFVIKLSETTENSATLTVTVKEFDLLGDLKEHSKDIRFKMIKENGKWLLTDMKY